MPRRWGLGPVFVYESLLNARRWQVYAGRSLFVAMLVIGLAVVWLEADRRASTIRSFQQMAEIGQNFFYALTGIQLSLVMIAAPAAAAGSICMDRARGTLLHMMVTDLSDSEIVLGKLGSRLAPVLGLLVCGVPVTALAALLGGIDFPALLGAFVVSLALAAVGCAMAITISVWAKKTHEVLMAVFMIEALYLLAVPIWWVLSLNSGLISPPDWFQKTNPFVLVFAPYNKPGFVEAYDYTIFVLVALAIAASLAGLSIAMLRLAVVSQTGRPEKAARRWVTWTRLFPSMIGPTLDGNPVLWREWHRSRPSRLSRLIWNLLFSITWALAAWGTFTLINSGTTNPPNALPFGFLFQYVFGLLMVSALAPTVLAEERVRASLDVLLSTPISTRSIVIGKWWGAFRWVLILAVLPLYCASFLAAISPAIPSYAYGSRFYMNVVALVEGDRIASSLLCPADFVASGAMIVSLGLALSTWVRRLGRAVALSVSAYLVGGIGWIILVQSSFFRIFPLSPYPQGDRSRWLMGAITSLSPIFGPMEIIEELIRIAFQSREFLWTALGVVVLTKLAIAGLLLGLTVKTFDRCLGRMPDSPRRATHQPVAIPEEPTTSPI